MDELIILAREPGDAITHGYLPAARRLGLRVVLLTDRIDAQRAHFAARAVPDSPDAMIACEVGDSLQVIGALTRRSRRPSALVTDSAQLHTCAALAAEYLHLPGKDWHVSYRAGDCDEMHARLRELGLESGAPPAGGAEPLRCLSTLGDGRELRALGSQLTAQDDAVLRIIREFGIGFGLCQTRYAATAQGPRIVGIDYCGPAGQAMFALQKRLGIALFEAVLRVHLGEPLPSLAPPPLAATDGAYGLTWSTIRRWASSNTQAFS